MYSLMNTGDGTSCNEVVDLDVPSCVLFTDSPLLSQTLTNVIGSVSILDASSLVITSVTTLSDPSHVLVKLDMNWQDPLCV